MTANGLYYIPTNREFGPDYGRWVAGIASSSLAGYVDVGLL